MSKIGVADFDLILTNEQQMCINIVSCIVLIKNFKIISKVNAIFCHTIHHQNYLHILGKLSRVG